MMPLLPHANRSVLSDFLDREVPTNTVYDYGEPMQAIRSGLADTVTFSDWAPPASTAIRIPDPTAEILRAPASISIASCREHRAPWAS